MIVNKTPRDLLWLRPVLCPLLTTACQQEMARQPSYRPLEPTDSFDDGRASRPTGRGHRAALAGRSKGRRS